MGGLVGIYVTWFSRCLCYVVLPITGWFTLETQSRLAYLRTTEIELGYDHESSKEENKIKNSIYTKQPLCNFSEEHVRTRNDHRLDWQQQELTSALAS